MKDSFLVCSECKGRGFFQFPFTSPRCDSCAGTGQAKNKINNNVKNLEIGDIKIGDELVVIKEFYITEDGSLDSDVFEDYEIFQIPKGAKCILKDFHWNKENVIYVEFSEDTLEEFYEEYGETCFYIDIRSVIKEVKE